MCIEINIQMNPSESWRYVCFAGNYFRVSFLTYLWMALVLMIIHMRLYEYMNVTLLGRCKDLEQHECSLAALKNVGVQAVVTEFLISRADILFTDSFMTRRREHAPGVPAGFALLAACYRRQSAVLRQLRARCTDVVQL